MYRFKQFILLVGDLAIGYAGLFVAVAIRTGTFSSSQFDRLLFPMSVLFVVSVLIMFVMGLYDVGRALPIRRVVQKFTVTALIWFGIGTTYFYILGERVVVTPKTILALTGLVSFTLGFVWHIMYNSFVAGRFLNQTVAFIGASPVSEELLNYLKSHPGLGYEIVGTVSSAGSSGVASFQSVEKLLTATKPSLLVIASDTPSPALNTELYQALFRQTSAMTASDLYEKIFGRVPPTVFSDAWFITHLREQDKRAYDRVRILFDYFASLFVGFAFVVTSPFIALAIKLSSPGPIFLKQTRVGRLGKTFNVIKYRTMRALSADGSAELTGPQFTGKHDPRITSVGKILRLARLDELPQFINILRGEMALIGPRPERPEFVAELTKAMPYYQLRLLVKPGITGWAQIHQSYFGDIQENLHKLEYDIFYIKNRGLLMDLAIVLRTLHVIGSLGGR